MKNEQARTLVIETIEENIRVLKNTLITRELLEPCEIAQHSILLEYYNEQLKKHEKDN